MKQTILTITLIFSVTLFIVAIVTYFLFDPRVSGLAYHFTLIPPDPYGLTSQERYEISSIITTAIKHSGSQAELRGTLESLPSITQKEVQHLVDVWLLLVWVKRVALLSLVIVSIGIFFWLKTQHLYVLEAFRRGAIVTLLLLTVIGVTSLFDWTRVFLYFHEVLFPPESYSFPQDNLLIRLYPESFWQLAAGVWWLASVILSGGLLVITQKYVRQMVNKTGGLPVSPEA
jgi:integral membrane protein (TIGR01906 family)